jgi:hypothetical protein
MDICLPSRGAGQVENRTDLDHVWCGKAGVKAKSAAFFCPVQRLFCPLATFASNGQNAVEPDKKIAADFAFTPALPHHT